MRHRRPAECRQVDAFQCADADGGGAGGELSRSAPSSPMSATSPCRTRASKSLTKIAGSKEIIPTRLTFVDIAGLVRGASKGEGLGNQFLANIRECDAIAHVVRCFVDGDITHVDGEVDPIARHRHDRDRADAGRSRTRWKSASTISRRRPRAATRKRRSNSISSTAASCCCARASRRVWSSGRRRNASPSTRSACCRRSPCSTSAMSRKPPPTTATTFPPKVYARAEEEGEVAVVVSAQIESEIAVTARRRAEGLSRSRRP